MAQNYPGINCLDWRAFISLTSADWFDQCAKSGAVEFDYFSLVGVLISPLS